MAQFCRNFAAIALLFGLVTVARAQSSNLSPDETATYINTTLHKYPTPEFVASGCPGFEQVVGISADRRSVTITQTLGQTAVKTCNVQTLLAPIFSLDRVGFGSWSKQGQHTTFQLDCVKRTDCFSRQATGKAFPFSENNWHLRLTAPDQVSKELSSAMQHLLDSLLAEANGHLNPNDPFAKHTR